jgi:Ca2+-transporting ATPase
VTIEQEPALEFLLAAAFLNNDAPIFEEQNKKYCEIETNHYGTSDATDIAMLCLFEKSILDADVYRERFTQVHYWPLDPKSKLITKVFKDNKTGKYVLFTKGATEVLLQKCSTLLNQTPPTATLDEKIKTQITSSAEVFAGLGQRIVSFGLREIDKFTPNQLRQTCETELKYIGFVAISDPPREGVRAAVAELKGAGIKSVMITGDNLVTAKSIAVEVGILEEGRCAVEGSQIRNLTSKEFANTTVFARVSPDDKRTIVTRFKEQKEVVAMPGDGVNDTQAILTADVGIAMGRTGTDVARQAADLVLTDDSFNSIVAGIRQGRGVFEKIQNIIFFYIAISIAEALVFFGSSFIEGFFVLQTWQLIYIATTQFAPSLALVTDQLSADVMKEKPRNNEGLISGKRQTALVIFALSLTVVLTIAYLMAFYDISPLVGLNKVGFVPNFNASDPLNPVNWEQAKARTMLLSVAVISQSLLVLSLRRLNKPVYKSLKQDWNKKIIPLIVAVPVFHAVLMYVPQIQYGLATLGINFEIIRWMWQIG